MTFLGKFAGFSHDETVLKCGEIMDEINEKSGDLKRLWCDICGKPRLFWGKFSGYEAYFYTEFYDKNLLFELSHTFPGVVFEYVN